MNNPSAHDIGPSGRAISSKAQRALDDQCERLQSDLVAVLSEEQNIAALRHTASRLGGMVAGGWLDHYEAVDKLTDVAAANGFPLDVAQAIIADGFAEGKRNPTPEPHDISVSPNRRKPARGKLISVRGSEVVMRPIRWGWLNRIAMGKPTMFAGEPGVGKSTLLANIAACFSVGGAWPCGEGHAPMGSVIVLSAEDDPADTIVPRYRAAGGDLEKLHIIRAVEDGENKRGFNLQADMQQLEKKIGDIADVACVIIDPVSSYMGKVDSHKNSDVRGVIDPLTELASSTGAAFLLNTHFPKCGAGNGPKAIHRFVGSIAFVGAARTAFAVVKDPDDERRVLLLPVKSNIGVMPLGLAYRIEQTVAGRSADGKDTPIEASRVVWDDEPVSMTADQAITASEDGPDNMDPKHFLQEALANGRMATTDLKTEAEAVGVSWASLRRAQKSLGVIASRESVDGRGVIGRWYWKLPSVEENGREG